jgi:hypothetical protein
MLFIVGCIGPKFATISSTTPLPVPPINDFVLVDYLLLEF